MAPTAVDIPPIIMTTTPITANIVVAAGDGIGPEVCSQAQRVLDFVATMRGHIFNFEPHLLGGCSIDATGKPLTDNALAACKAADAVLMGAVGGPKWAESAERPEQGLLMLRKEMGVFSNIRPLSLISEDVSFAASPLKVERIRNVDFVVVRELTGGIYFGDRKETDVNGIAYDTMIYTVPEIERITRVAGQLARRRRQKVTSIDKANALASSRLWRKTVSRVMLEEFPDVALDHMLVDATAMKLILAPAEFDVILTSNLFGDILTDEASVLAGSIGLLPSASIGGCGGLYEPIHGSAPDIVGRGIANPIGSILSAAMLLRHSLDLEDEAKAIELAVGRALADGLRTPDIAAAKGNVVSTRYMTDTIIRHLRDILNIRPMTLSEKVLAHNAIGLKKPEVRPGDMLRLHVSWTIASELTWKGMEKTYDEMGRPDIYRNDRFWLAVDHTVDPSINHQPKPTALIKSSEEFAKEAKLTDYHGPNETILHTDFYRNRAQPGQIVVGADSHSCSAGAVGAWAVGLGAADVMMPTVTGETWMQVPETVRINFVGQLPFGIGGKDVILYTMGQLKRNTIAFERAVEYTGRIDQLSCDARFAISNMTAEFGGIVGIFEADQRTTAFLAKRDSHNSDALFFRADKDAQYVKTYDIDLSKISSLVALFPSPDNVVPVSEVAGQKLDGCFIGACTTAEEDLILGALVLEAAFKIGITPVTNGKRKVTPGSISIVARLRKLGLLDIYSQAGFEVGAPGCSYCLGIAADRAGEGEVWLSSQNRNFRNRMGKGSIGNLASAATVAASSLSMCITDPSIYLHAIDRTRFAELMNTHVDVDEPIVTVEPHPVLFDSSAPKPPQSAEHYSLMPFKGKVQMFGDHVDTDAIIPAEFMPGVSDEDLGTHTFQYVRENFVSRVKDGDNIVVAGIGFGCGSSREEAPRALKGCGVKAVIAKSYAFIYSRNQPNMGLLGIIIKEQAFYDLVSEGCEVTVDVPHRTVTTGNRKFVFSLTHVEERLLAGGGMIDLYTKHKNNMFREVTSSCGKGGGCTSNETLNW